MRIGDESSRAERVGEKTLGVGLSFPFRNALTLLFASFFHYLSCAGSSEQMKRYTRQPS
jgi:hypothetical protein